MRRSPIQLIKYAFSGVYAQNDAQKMFFNTEDSHLSRFAAFIEVPSWREKTGKTEPVYFPHRVKKEKERDILKPQTWRNLGKKFIGWQDNVSVGKKILNVFLAIFFFVPINTATVLIRTPINIIRLFTDFLPWIISFAAYGQLMDMSKEKKKSAGTIALGILLGIVHGVTLLISLASASLFNPVRTLGEAWKYGRNHPMIRHPVLRILLGATLATLSLAFTIIGYTLLAGIPAIQTAAAAVLHSAAVALPQVISAFSATGIVIAKVVSALLGFIPTAGQFIAAGVAAMPELFGIVGLAALLTPTIGSVLGPLVERFKENWYASSTKKVWLNPLNEEDEDQDEGFSYTPARTPGPSSYSKIHQRGLSMTAARPDEDMPSPIMTAASASASPPDDDNDALYATTHSDDGAAPVFAPNPEFTI